MLQTIKTLLGVSGKDDVLQALIDMCIEEFKEITHREDYSESIIVRMVMHRYSLLNSQGLTAENIGGATFNYLTDYPADLYRLIISKRKVRTA